MTRLRISTFSTNILQYPPPLWLKEPVTAEGGALALRGMTCVNMAYSCLQAIRIIAHQANRIQNSEFKRQDWSRMEQSQNNRSEACGTTHMGGMWRERSVESYREGRPTTTEVAYVTVKADIKKLEAFSSCFSKTCFCYILDPGLVCRPTDKKCYFSALWSKKPPAFWYQIVADMDRSSDSAICV